MAADTLRVLFLVPQLPYPPEQGAALRNYHILRRLTARHRVTLIGFAPSREQSAAAELRRICEQVIAIPLPVRAPALRLAAQLRPLPDLAVRLRSAPFAAAVAQHTRLARFDLVQCEALELFPYAAAVPAPMILDEHNAEWRLQQRAYLAARAARRPVAALYSLLQTQKLRRYEATALRQATQRLAVSAADREDLRRIAPGLAITVLPNGVDADTYAPRPDISDDGDGVLFAGKMDFRPNVEGAMWLTRQVMPLVWQRRPAATLTLFGRDPAPAVQALADGKRVIVTGHMPGVDAEKQALAQAAVVAVPLLAGGGTRLKVLNALAMARPLVSTPFGAEGYDLRSGEEVLLAAGAPAFASALLRLLEDRALARRLGEAGRTAVKRRYTWDRLLPALDDVYAGIARA